MTSIGSMRIRPSPAPTVMTNMKAASWPATHRASSSVSRHRFEILVETVDGVPADVLTAPTGSSTVASSANSSTIWSGGTACHELQVAVDAGSDVLGGDHGARLHGTPERLGEFGGAGHRQVAHPAAARRRHRDRAPGRGRTATGRVNGPPTTTSRPSHPAGRGQQLESAPAAATATCSGPRTAASATASQCPAERGATSSGECASSVCAAASPSVQRARHRRGGRRSAAPRRSRTPRRCGAVDRVGGPDHQLLGVVGGIEPTARPVRVGEMPQRQFDQSGGPVEPARFAGQLVHRQKAGGQHRVILQDRRAVTDRPTEAGPPESAVDQMKIDEVEAQRSAASRSPDRPARHWLRPVR